MSKSTKILKKGFHTVLKPTNKEKEVVFAKNQLITEKVISKKLSKPNIVSGLGKKRSRESKNVILPRKSARLR
jgi:hypothetical protein